MLSLTNEPASIHIAIMLCRKGIRSYIEIFYWIAIINSNIVRREEESMSLPLDTQGRKRQGRAKRLHLVLVVGLLWVLSMTIPVSPVYPAQRHHAQMRAAYTVSGTVFDDYNQDGTQQSREPGLNGVVVTAYNAANTAVTTATTATLDGTSGQYTLNLPDGTGPVRIQFSNFGATSTVAQLIGYQPSGHTGGTAVAFVDG